MSNAKIKFTVRKTPGVEQYTVEQRNYDSNGRLVYRNILGSGINSRAEANLIKAQAQLDWLG